ncbi:glutathione S-transferase [Babesia caballi]|uniref:Glutathione S-transferase n=1 Tax=Babesia caballi TaxID=5871 RepID=A0AAV4LYD8_BABCB|nr:glutathione S-transferase [Babesia caballi]
MHLLQPKRVIRKRAARHLQQVQLNHALLELLHDYFLLHQKDSALVGSQVYVNLLPVDGEVEHVRHVVLARKLPVDVFEALFELLHLVHWPPVDEQDLDVATLPPGLRRADHPLDLPPVALDGHVNHVPHKAVAVYLLRRFADGRAFAGAREEVLHLVVGGRDVGERESGVGVDQRVLLHHVHAAREVPLGAFEQQLAAHRVRLEQIAARHGGPHLRHLITGQRVAPTVVATRFFASSVPSDLNCRAHPMSSWAVRVSTSSTPTFAIEFSASPCTFTCPTRPHHSLP